MTATTRLYLALYTAAAAGALHFAWVAYTLLSRVPGAYQGPYIVNAITGLVVVTIAVIGIVVTVKVRERE